MLKLTTAYRGLIAALLLLLTGCAAAPEEFAGRGPLFVLEEYFVGRFHMVGMLQDEKGLITRQFRGRMQGELLSGGRNATLRLTQWFDFADGERNKRQWLIKRVDPHNYEATSSDFHKPATGEVYGQALQWSYLLKLDDNGFRAAMDDWMYLQADGRTVINRGRMTRYGQVLGDLTVVITKVE